MKRLIFDCILLLFIFIMPWWVSAIVAISGMFLFQNFYEFIGTAVIFFALYSVPGSGIFSTPVWFALIISAIFIGVQTFKSYSSLYA